MNATIKDVFEKTRKELPSVFGVKTVSELLPGIIAPRSIYNYLGRGEGPPCKRVGRRIILERDSFLDWLENRHLKTDKEIL